jgi:hypothetical protein
MGVGRVGIPDFAVLGPARHRCLGPIRCTREADPRWREASRRVSWTETWTEAIRSGWFGKKVWTTTETCSRYSSKGRMTPLNLSYGLWTSVLPVERAIRLLSAFGGPRRGGLLRKARVVSTALVPPPKASPANSRSGWERCVPSLTVALEGCEVASMRCRRSSSLDEAVTGQGWSVSIRTTPPTEGVNRQSARGAT